MSEFFSESDCEILNNFTGEQYIPLERANRLLRERGTVLYSSNGHDNLRNWYADNNPTETHTALLINIQPIERDSLEAIVTELAKMARPHWVDFSEGYKTEKLNHLVKRARKLLGDTK